MITNVPRITDIAIMAEVLRRLGCDVAFDDDGRRDGRPGRRRPVLLGDHRRADEPGTEADYDLVRRLRASICVLGPLLARRGHVRVAHPGGDAIGSRGLDMHVAGLARMGAEISGEHGFVIASAPARAARRDDLAGLPQRRRHREPGDGGGTGQGRHRDRQRGARAGDRGHLHDAHRDGRADRRRRHLDAARSRASTELRPVSHATVGDRIVAGTWAFGAAMTRGDVTVTGATRPSWRSRWTSWSRPARRWRPGPTRFRVRMDRRPTAVDVVTLPFPGFATDLLPMAIGLAAVSEGASLVTENIFDGRFMFVQRDGPARRGHQDRRAPRGGPGSGAAVRRPGAGHRHPGRRRPGHRRALRRRGHRGLARAPRRPGLPGLRRRPAGLGVEVERATAPEEPAFTS